MRASGPINRVAVKGWIMKRLIIDLDGTLTQDEPARAYSEKEPDVAVVARLRQYKESGFSIAINTSRNMQTFQNSIGLINARTLPIIIDWLQRHAVPYDEIHVGKPWCGTEGFYVDDRAIRPGEFVNLSYADVMGLVGPKSLP